MMEKPHHRIALHQNESLLTQLTKDMNRVVSEAASIRTESTMDMSTLNSDTSTLRTSSSENEEECDSEIRQRMLAEFEARTRECTKKVDQFLKLVQERRLERLKPC